MKRLAESILAHRLVLNPDAELSGVSQTAVVDDVLETVEPPSVEPDDDGSATFEYEEETNERVTHE